ncbi:MAG: SusE domain-containing protein [Bacteroidetes bacterium]|nr:SusE domain-containing protein [Bacteroidota bacterium]MBS1541461.1 SusE domain-containing protein [Bacteroidota bacterium]
MKINKILTVLLAAGFVVASCNNPETKVTYSSGTAPVLTVSSTADLTLTPNPDNSVLSSLQFQWTNPNYMFSNGVNTQDVNYTLQIDTVGSNFTNPNMAVIAFTNVVANNFTVKALNAAVGQLQLNNGVPHQYSFRIISTLTNKSLPLYSNVVNITITPYLDVVFPVPAELFITGSATPLSWMGGGDPPATSQQFTKVNAFLFVLNDITLIGGQEFLLVPVYGNWTHKYAFTTADGNNPMGDFFYPDAPGNFKGPGATGNYKITVNFSTGKYTITSN